MNDRRFYLADIFRGIFQGILETWWLSVGLLVGIKLFSAPDLVKSAVSAANYLGLLLSPILVYIAVSKRIRPGNILFFCLLMCSVFLFLCARFDTAVFLLFSYLIAAALNDAQWPFLTAMYGVAYPQKIRGKRLGVVLSSLLLSASVFAWFSGWLLDVNLEFYRWLLICASISALLAGFCCLSMQRSLQVSPVSSNYLKGIRLVLKDFVFLRLLASWMLLGLGNTMVLPLRMIYLTKDTYGLEFSSETIALLTLSVVFVARIISTPLWGIIYDRLSFPCMRDLVCVFFAAGIFVFFNSSSLFALGLGSVLSGIGMGGGFLLWNIWVTQYAPKEQVLSYMSVNVFLTGIRGALAPFLGFWIAGKYGLEVAVMLGVSALFLAVLVRK